MIRFQKPPASWTRKFAHAGRGLRRAVRTQSSFAVHMAAAGAVAIAAVALRVDVAEGCLLALCVSGVFAAELFNSALERLARAITRERDGRVRDALDMASAAVLATALGAVAVGAIIFLRRLVSLFAG